MVSILLAAYEGERHLPAQLSSLQRQSYPNFRVYWQDDGSSDGTLRLLQEISAEDSRFLPGQTQRQHLGAIGNFLNLLTQDDAAYSALCDQDDDWHPDKLSRCMAAMHTAEEHFGPDTPLLVHHDCRVTDANGSPLHDSFFRHQGWDGAASTLPPLLVQNNVTGCTCVMNAALRRLVVSHAAPERLFMHDWFIALTAAAFGQIVFVNEPLVNYRQHDTNVMGASKAGLLRRGLNALHSPAKAKARIALTYQHAHVLRESFGDTLPPESREIIDRFIAIEALPKAQRIRALYQGGYLMQRPIARIGQIIFG